MAAMNLSSTTHTTSLRSHSGVSRTYTHIPSKTLSFHTTHLKNLSFFSFNLKPNHTTKRPSNLLISAVGKLSETELVPVPPDFEPVFPSSSGVYAVYDNNGDMQFLGLSRNIQASILFHQKSLPHLCASIKVGVVDNPDRTALTEAWKSWMEEHIQVTGKVPPGNEKGNTTWVRQAQAQPKKKADLRITPGQHVQLTVPLEELIDRMVKENKVVAFIKGSRSAPQCGFSQRVVGILDSEGVNYESVDVLDEEHNRGLRETLKRYSNWPTFPQVFVNGELLGGCDILSSMHDSGELAGLFKQ